MLTFTSGLLYDVDSSAFKGRLPDLLYDVVSSAFKGRLPDFKGLLLTLDIAT